MSASPPEVRAARQFLRQKLKAGTQDVNPRHFANSAKELGMGFNDLASTLARIYAGGQNASFYREQALEANLRSTK
jgi:hypothetical protein